MLHGKCSALEKKKIFNFSKTLSNAVEVKQCPDYNQSLHSFLDVVKFPGAAQKAEQGDQ